MQVLPPDEAECRDRGAELPAHGGRVVSGNLLVHSRIVAGLPGTDRTRALAHLLRYTIRSMADDPGNAKPYRALDATFLHGAPTQEAAASALRLPFTTFRRHLTRGIDLVSELRWRQELAA